jgi:precorrin-6B methylase 2
MDWSILLFTAYILILAFLLWIAWPIIIGAIFLPTPPRIVGKMLDLAEVEVGDVLYDIGSGDGRIILAAAERGAHAVGIEADPARVLWSKYRAWRSQTNSKLSIVWGNFFRVNVSEATVVTVYQGESINSRLKEKFEAELRPGTRVVSYAFTFEGWEVRGKDPEAAVYLYVVCPGSTNT